MYYKFAILIILLIYVFQSKAQTSKEVKLLEHLEYKKDIIYKTIDGDTLDMIMFFPSVKKYPKSPVMLYTHGGGWGGGNKYNISRTAFIGTLRILLENGITCASIEYRLTRVGKSTAFDCVVDCKDAARFLIKNAGEFGIDTERMGVWGGSAGGHLCLMTALGRNKDFTGDELLKSYNPKFVCVASYYPLTSFTNAELLKGSNFENPKRFIPIFGGLLSDNITLAKSINPVELLKKKSPPILLLHGEKDKVLPISQSQLLVERGNIVGADVRLITIKNAGHSFNGEHISPTIDVINQISADFIIKALANK